MPTVLTHAVVGYAAARAAGGRRRPPARILIVATVLPVVPDLDVFLAPAFGFGYGHPLGHRGFSHSLAFALILGVLAAVACRRDGPSIPGGVGALGLLFTAAAASHCLLDALTDGGMGMPLFMPFGDGRYFFPVQPIPVSPIGLSSFLSEWGWAVLRAEVLLVWPFAAAAAAWPWLGPRRGPAAAALLVGAGVAAWAWRLGWFGLQAGLGATRW